MRNFIASLAVAVAGLAAAPAWAHAHLVSSEPAVGGTVVAPNAVHITYSEGVEIRLSKFEVLGADGKALPGGAAALDPKDKATVIVTFPAPLAAGSYTVHWRVVSADTHRTEGTFPFTVKP